MNRIKLFITFWLIITIFAYGEIWAENARLDLTRALVEEGRLEIDSFFNNTGDRAFIRGHYYSDAMPGASFLAIPIYVGMRSLWGPVTYQNSLMERNLQRDHVLFLFLLIALINAPLAALTLVLFYELTARVLKRVEIRLFFTAVLGLGTIFFHSARQFTSSILSTAFLFFAFYLYFRFKEGKTERMFLAGVFAGFAILMEFGSVLLVGGLAFLLIRDKKAFYKFLIGIVPSLLLIVAYNTAVTGTPLNFPVTFMDLSIWPQSLTCRIYQGTDMLEDCRRMIQAEREGRIDRCESIDSTDFKQFCFARVSSASSYCQEISSLSMKLNCYSLKLGFLRNFFLTFSFFSMEKFSSIFYSLFSTYQGLFIYSPILLLGVLALPFVPRQYRKEFYVLLGALGLLLTHYLYYFQLGTGFGPRKLTLFTPFLMFFVLFFFKRAPRVTVFIGIFSLLVSFLGLQPFEHWAFEVQPAIQTTEDAALQWRNPLLEYYLPLTLQYGPRSLLLEDLFRVQFPPWSNMGIILLLLVMVWWRELKACFQKATRRSRWVG